MEESSIVKILDWPHYYLPIPEGFMSLLLLIGPHPILSGIKPIFLNLL
jgi:hypothetical protein